MADSISRQDVIGVIDNAEKIYVNNLPPMVYAHTLEQAIMAIPAQPQRIGHWIEDDNEMFVICSECGEKNDYISAFCPDCGARMEDEK